MEYPGTKFTRPIRLAMLILFIVAFFVISPLIILYTAGYRYDWQNGLLKETGSISIDIEPRNATASLNGIKLQKDLPIRLNNITPGKYNLHLTASGNMDWFKEIEVKNKQTNYIKEISLIKKTKAEIIITDRIEDFSVSPNGSSLIYTVPSTTNLDFWMLHTASQEKNHIANMPSIDKPSFVWATNNNFVAIVSSKKPYTEITIIDTENQTRKIKSIKQNTPIEKINWNNSTEPQLYYSTKENIYVYYPLTDKTQIATANIYIDWQIYDGQLWTIQPEKSSQTYVAIKDTLGFKSIAGKLDQKNFLSNNTQQNNEKPLEILDARANTLLIKNKIDQKMILVHNQTTHTINAEKFLVSPYNNWWLFWSQWELWTYSEGDEPRLLNRSGEQLQQVLPLDSHNTLALIWNERNTVLFPYYLVTHELVTEKIKAALTNTAGKVLYFTSKNTDGIWKANY
jgi:hypothetical protein